MEQTRNMHVDRSGKPVLLHALKGITQSASAMLIVVMPKCSICLAAYLNVFSLMGLSVARYAKWVLPVLVAVIILSLLTSFSKARKLNDYRAFGLLVAGSALLFVVRFRALSEVLSWIAFAMILGATIVQLVQSRRVCDRDILNF